MRLYWELLCIQLIVRIIPSFGAAPSGCTYDTAYASTGIYTCVFGSYTSPLTYSAFSNPGPQRLKITSLTGTFPSSGSAFSGFSAFTSGMFDANYPASLELVCTTSGTLTLSASTFTDMGYLQEVKFSYCNIVSLAANMLSKFVSLNSLRFEYGSIASYSVDFLTGLSIEALSVPDPKGEFVIQDCTITPKTIPANLFDPLTKAKIIKLENAGITAIDKAAFSLATAVTYISLADNGATTLDNDLFKGLNALSTLDLGGIAYDCTCGNLGVLSSALRNSVTILSGLICNTPATYQNKKATKYYAEVCTKTQSCSQTALGPLCMSVYEIVGLSLLIVTLIISAVALAIICHTRRQLMTATSNMEKRRKGSWTKVRDAMNIGDLSDKKPPMKGHRKG